MHSRAAALTAVLAMVGAAGLMTMQATSAYAAPATRYVAVSGDDTDNDCTDQANPCKTVQHAVDQADAGDTVSIGAGVFHEAVHIRQSLTVTGAGSSGAGRTTIDGPSDCCDSSIFIDGFDSDSVPEVTIQNLDVSGNAGDAGIRILEGIGHVNSSVVSNNTDEGILLQQLETVKSAIKPADEAIVPSVTVSNSTVDNNGATDEAAGIFVETGRADVDHSSVSANGQGGVVVDSGTAHIDTSTLNGNVGAAFVLDAPGAVGSFTDSTASNSIPFSDSEGPAFGGGILVFFGGTLNVDTSTIANNVGQGVLSEGGYVHIDDSTISGTKPSHDGFLNGGIVVESQIQEDSRAAAANRFTGHAGSPRPTAAKPAAVALPATAIQGTIVADNTTIADCNGTVQDAGYNLASDDSCNLTATGSIAEGHARLGPLADNGGPTLTMKPAKASDARDKIPSGTAGCDPATTDQRGDPRLAGPKCDIGAVELAQPPVLITPNALPNGTVGKTYHQVIHLSGGLGSPYTMTISAGSLPPGLALGDDGSIGGVPTQAGTFHFTVSVDDPTLKDYTIVIEAAASEPLANTGPNVRPYAYLGAIAVGLGLLMLVASGALGRWYRRYLRQH